jgi:hypothetical protein
MRSRDHGSLPPAVVVAVAALVVLLTGTTVVADDVRAKSHCSDRGNGPGISFRSTVDSPGRFVGLSEVAATQLARREGYVSRIACRDGRDMVGTLDVRRNRVNFGVHHGRVVGYWLG